MATNFRHPVKNVRNKSTLAPGTTLGPYIIADPIGSGAHATVYLASTEDGVAVALKVCRAMSATAQHRFLREFESLRLLQAPGIVRVRDAGVDGDCVWFSMERIFGRPFHDDLLQISYAGERVEQTVQRSIRLLSTLASLHETGFAHRDLKPSNVLVDAGGIPHVLDFGVSRWFENEGSTTNIIAGTVPYMAPEQMGGLHTSTAADLFAVGLMMHEAIAGMPKSSATPMGWIVQTCLEQRPALATLYREAPLALSALVEDMTHVDPARRPTAAQALRTLRLIRKGQGRSQWPSPRFVDPGPWFGNLEDAVGERKLVVLEGPSGSGKRRVVEQIHRQCLLEGRWTIHLRCEAHVIGAPWLQLLQTASRTLREEQIQAVVGEDGQAIGALWPHLGLPRDNTTATTRGASYALDATTRIIRRLCASTAILLVLEQLEQIDGFSARILLSLASSDVPIIALYDPRWATPRSTAVTRRLLRQPRSVRIVARPPVDAGEIGRTLHLSAPKQLPPGTSAIQAAAVGWRALGIWRNTPWPTPAAPLGALAILEHPMPMPVMRTLCGKALERSSWVRPDRGGVVLAEQNTRAWLLASLSDRSGVAGKVASVWESAMGTQADPQRLAQLWLAAGQDAKALVHSVHAAVQADRQGNYTAARQWVLLAESIGLEQLSESMHFALAHVTARVALRTDAKTPRTSLIRRASSLARRGTHRLMVQLVEAEYAIRNGDARIALAGAVHVGANHRTAPRTAARALLVCVHARILLDDLAGAARELKRARALIADIEAPYLEVQAMSWAAEIKWHNAEYDSCQQWCTAAINRANKRNYPRGKAFPSARLSMLLRMRGHRRTAERFARKALSAFERTGDVAQTARASLALATLLAERGDLLAARQRLDAAVRQIRILDLTALLPDAMRLTLDIAALRADAADAGVALSVLAHHNAEESAAAQVRWWRSRGEPERALAVQSNHRSPWGDCLWGVERARAAWSAGQTELAQTEAARAHVIAIENDFLEVALFSALISEGLNATDPDQWAHLLHQASTSPWVALTLTSLELDAYRKSKDDRQSAARTLRTVVARARELGFQANVEEALARLRDLE